MPGTAGSIIEIGTELIEQKKALGHGNFLPWIEAEFSMSERTAQNMIRVAETFGGKSAGLADLGKEALYALAALSTPEPVRDEVLDRASRGETFTAADIKAMKEKYLLAQAAPDLNPDLG